MKAERQHKEPQKAEPIQSKRERSKLRFIDNRPQAVSQAKTIDRIQLKQIAISLPIQRVRLSTNGILRDALQPEYGRVAHHIIPDSFVVQAINENQLDLDEYEQFYDDESNGMELTIRNHNRLHHQLNYDGMVVDAVEGIDLSDINDDDNRQEISRIEDALRERIEGLFDDPAEDDDAYSDEDNGYSNEDDD